MKDLYRRSALERLSSPEQTDKVIRIAPSMSWLSLAAAAAVLVFIAVWSFAASIPEEIRVKGVIDAPADACTVYAHMPGKVERVHVAVGDEVDIGAPMMTLAVPQGACFTVPAPQRGTVSEIIVPAGGEAGENEALIRILPKGAPRVVCSVPAYGANRIGCGAQARVTLGSVQESACEPVTARVICIGTSAGPAEETAHASDEGGGMKEEAADGEAVSVTLELDADPGVTVGSDCLVSLIIGESRPVDRLLSAIRDR